MCRFLLLAAVCTVALSQPDPVKTVVEETGGVPLMLEARRLLSMTSIVKWLGQPFQDTIQGYAAPSLTLFYKPTGLWHGTETIHEYMNLFTYSQWADLVYTEASVSVPHLNVTVYYREQTKNQHGINWLTSVSAVAGALPPALARWQKSARAPNRMQVTQQRVWLEMSESDGTRVRFQTEVHLTFRFARGSPLVSSIVVETPNVDSRFPDVADTAVLWAGVLQKFSTEFWCTATKRVCGPRFPYAGISDCVDHWSTLPFQANETVCAAGRVAAGNSVLCRIVHMESAGNRPAHHCPHTGRQSTFCNECQCQETGSGEACVGLVE